MSGADQAVVESAALACDHDARSCRFADLVRLRLGARRLLPLADEKELLTVAVCELGLSFDDARAIVLRLAADRTALIESLERQRVAQSLRANARDRKISRDGLREATMLARPLADAVGPTGNGDAAGSKARSRAMVGDIARAEGLVPEGRSAWLLPRRWFETRESFRHDPADTRRAWRRAV